MTGTVKDFESRMERLKEIVESLEREDLPLERGILLYKEGLELSKGCREILDTARREIELMTEQGPVPFASDEESKKT